MAFLAPWLVGLVTFTLIPIGLALYYSVCDYTLSQPPVYTGADDYRNDRARSMHEGIE